MIFMSLTPRLTAMPRRSATWLQIKCSAAQSSAAGGSPAAQPAPGTAAQQQQQPEAGAAELPQQTAAPWVLSNYYTKKLSRETDPLGNIMSSPDTIAAAPGWTPDAQLRLAAEALAAELQQDAGTLLDRVHQLQALLPGMDSTLRRMKPAEMIRMTAQLEQIGQQLIVQRGLLPTADVAAVVAAHPSLLRMQLAEVEAALALVREAFPEASQEDVDAMLTVNGSLLDGGASLERCLRGVSHLMSRPQIMRCLQRDPSFLYQFQPLEGQSRGERDADYLADTFRTS